MENMVQDKLIVAHMQVSAGLKCMFAQDVVAINAKGKHCCNLGELNKRAVVTPDVDSMLDAINDL